MNIFASLGIVLLAMLIQCFFQLSPSIFTIFYHHTLGKSSAKKADGLSLYYILGSEVFIFVFFLLIYLFVSYIFASFGSTLNTILPWVFAGIFIALSLISVSIYFRKGSGTALFISRRLAKKIFQNTKKINTSSDAFILGFTSAIPELIFSVPLFIAMSFALLTVSQPLRVTLIFSYVIVSIIPLFVYYSLFHSGHNLAEIERRRIKNKTFCRFTISLGFIILASIMLNIGILGNG